MIAFKNAIEVERRKGGKKREAINWTRKTEWESALNVEITDIFCSETEKIFFAYRQRGIPCFLLYNGAVTFSFIFLFSTLFAFRLFDFVHFVYSEH